jgi:DNA-binding response OmpR family regulator
VTEVTSARILAHYLGGEDALPALSRVVLEKAGIQVMAAADRAALRKLAVASHPDALLVSLQLIPQPARALPVLRRLYGRQGLAVIVLTPSSRSADYSRILAAGADDALVAPGDAALLAARLEAALRTVEQFAAPSAWTRGVLRTPDAEIAVDARAQRCLVREEGRYREILLTRKQLAALSALLRAGGRPVGWDQLFRRGWRPSKLRRRSRTLVQHVLALRRKLGRAGERIKSVPGVGYRLSI